MNKAATLSQVTLLLTAFWLLLLGGCTSQETVINIPRDAPTVILGDCRRANDPAFTPQEQTLITTTRTHLEKRDAKPVDAYYRVQKTAEGFEVYVQFVGGYTGNQPNILPGDFCVVRLQTDGTVLKVLPGA